MTMGKAQYPMRYLSNEVVLHFSPMSCTGLRSRSAERLIDRNALFAKQFGSFFSNVETIFQSNAELAINRDHRFVAETHTRLKPGLVAAHEVGPLVPVQTYAVARAMRQPRNFII